MKGALTNTAGTGSCGLQLEDVFVEAAGDDTEEVLTVEVGGILALNTQGTISIIFNLCCIHNIIHEAAPNRHT